MSKFTPGPWFIDPKDPKSIQAPDDDLTPWGVAEAIEDCGYGDPPQTLANARLIAAAPDLLEELKRAVVELEHEGFTCFKARDAIKKATGDQ